MNAYDEIPYPGYPSRYSHPDRMAVVGRLLGMKPASAARSRVLELGAGDGGNLIPLAYALPDSEFVGIDLAEAPIERGRALACELGLTNVRLLAMDLCDLGSELGEFDYLIAHGLYSWVPEPVRRRILEIARDHLAPHGIAYINYNAQPGGHVRLMLREMLLYHTRGIEDPREKIAQAQAFLRTLSESPALTDEYGAMVKAEAGRLLASDGAFLYHDELSGVFEPIAFHEFMAAARSCGLQYLADAKLGDTRTITGPLAAWLERYPDDVEREQHLDFLKYRSFRHTLLCRAEAPLPHGLCMASIADLWAASNAVVTEGEETAFATSRGTVRTAHPLACALLATIVRAWPQAVPVRSLIQKEGPATREVVCALLLQVFAGGIVDLYETPPAVARVAGERPGTTALARAQARMGSHVTTPMHSYINVTDQMAQRLIGLLDGTRDRAALLAALDPPATAEALEAHLAELVRFGLLV